MKKFLKDQIFIWGSICSIIGLVLTAYAIFGPLISIEQKLRNLNCGQQFPFQISGYASYNGNKLDGINVTVTNLESGKFESMLTVYGGEYIFELANWKDCIATGDRIETKACFEGECESKISIVDLQHSPIQLNIDIRR